MCQTIPLYALQHKEKKTLLFAAGLPQIFRTIEVAEKYLRYIHPATREEYEPVEIIIQQRFP